MALGRVAIDLFPLFRLSEIDHQFKEASIELSLQLRARSLHFHAIPGVQSVGDRLEIVMEAVLVLQFLGLGYAACSNGAVARLK